MLDNTEWRVQVDDALVDLHLETVPSLGTLTVGGLSGGNLERLGWHSDGTLDVEILILGTSDQIVADYKGDNCGQKRVSWSPYLSQVP